MSPSINLASALKDFVASLKQWRVWIFWAQHELHQRYRRSFLGPLWISFTMAFHILAMGVVWAILFHVPYQIYIPYIGLGLVMWTLVSNIMAEGATCFIASQGLITQTVRPLPTYFFQMLYRNVLNFGHNFIVFIIIAFVFHVVPSAQVVFLPIAFLLMLLGVGWIGLVFGIASVRYRDVPNLIQSLLVVLIFVTPIMFQKKDLAAAPFIVQLNPLYHLIEIVRAPLLGQTATLADWIWSVAFTFVGWCFTLVLYGRYRTRIAYWL